VALRPLTPLEFKRAKKNRKKGQRLRAEVLPVRDAILTGIGANPSSPNFRDRSGHTNRQRVTPIAGVTTSRLKVARSVRSKAELFTNSALGRIAVAPQGSIQRILNEMRSRRAAAPVAEPIQAQSDVQSLYTHLGIGQTPNIGAVDATRQPVYDLIDFERQGRSVRLTQANFIGVGQGASFQFPVPSDFSMRLHGVEVSFQSGATESIWTIQAGWRGAADAVNYTRLEVKTDDVPEPIFGIATAVATNRWTREEPLDIPQDGVLTINSGLDFDAGDIVAITVQYELKPSFNRIEPDPTAWITT